MLAASGLRQLTTPVCSMICLKKGRNGYSKASSTTLLQGHPRMESVEALVARGFVRDEIMVPPPVFQQRACNKSFPWSFRRFSCPHEPARDGVG